MGRIRFKGIPVCTLALAMHDVLWTPLESGPRSATALAHDPLHLGFATPCQPRPTDPAAKVPGTA